MLFPQSPDIGRNFLGVLSIHRNKRQAMSCFFRLLQFIKKRKIKNDKLHYMKHFGEEFSSVAKVIDKL